ncbi:MAG: PAS domain S-box protein [Betaproteobacteria bacterium]|nr:PAS domain S-box protein [Betaproteobacteria bacterium]
MDDTSSSPETSDSFLPAYLESVSDYRSYFRIFFEKAPTGVVIFGLNHQILDANPHFCELLGYACGELKFAPCSKILAPEDCERNVSEFGRLVSGASATISLSSHFVCRDGQISCLLMEVSPVRDEMGRVVQLLGLVSSGDERSVTRSWLTRQIRMNESLLHIASDGIHVLDAQGLLVEMSDSFCMALGYPREEMQGMHVSAWDAKWSADELRERIVWLMRHGEATFETRHRCKDGTLLDVEIHAKSFNLGDETLLFCSSRDISIRKESESLIRLQAGALDNSINGIAIADATLPDYPLIYVNPAFENITGYSSAEVIGKNCRFLQRDDRNQPDGLSIRQALQERRAVKATLRNYRKDGTMFWNRFQIAPVHDKEGSPTHFVAIINDITERKISDDYLKLVSRVFLHADESIFITDPDGWIIEVNPAFTRTTGYSREEVLGRNPRILQSGRHDHAFFASLWDAVLSKGHWSGEIWNRRKNGEIYPDKLTISVVKNDEGETLSYVCISSDISLLKAQQSELELMALHDPLTGLPNRALLNDRLSMALAESRRSGGKMAVCFIDLDDFKPVNDTYGHETGDLLLIEVAHRMSAILRATDTVARLGGDEFILILSEIQSEQELLGMLTRIMDAIAKPYALGEISVTISASIGVTIYPDDNADADTLLRHADQAMYLAKEKGRNCFHFFDVVDDRNAHLRSEGRARVELALQRREFELFYQPKVDLRNGQVVGLEALIRWRHPEQGLLLPADFLPLIENSEFETRLSEWVISEALRQMTQWQWEGLDMVVSVNLPARHLHSDRFIPFIVAVLAENPEIPRDRLELEVLETVALWDIPRVTQTMEECRRHGVMFSIDDFGTGYASLAYLRRLPVNTIKIDQSFTRDMLNDADDLSIVEGVISLAEAFQKNVIAEGVESVDHGTVLLYLGCRHAQGFGIARPMEASLVPGWINEFQPFPAWTQTQDKRLSRKDIALVFAEVWHRRWVDDLGVAIDQQATSSLAITPRECGFGEWLCGAGKSAYGHLPQFSEVESLHEMVHLLVRELVQLGGAGRFDRAGAQLPELQVLRDRLIRALHELIATI